ncbi:MAG: trehalose phosphatase, partial [Pseudomonadota bacterium]
DAALNAAQSRGMSVRAWIVEEPGLGGVYAVVKANEGTPEARLAELEAPLAARLTSDWRVHRNGNNLALLPPPVSKRRAARWLLERLRADGPLLSIGVGDSLSDLDFMRLCDAWMAPAQSQIDRALPSEPWAQRPDQ